MEEAPDDGGIVERDVQDISADGELATSLTPEHSRADAHVPQKHLAAGHSAVYTPAPSSARSYATMSATQASLAARGSSS